MRFSFKLILGYLGILLLLFIVNFLTYTSFFKKIEYERLKTSEVIVGKRLADRIFRFIIEDKNEEITALLFEEKKLSNKRFDYLIVSNNDNKVVAHTFISSEIPSELQSLKNTLDNTSEEFLIQKILSDKLNVYDILVPVYEGIKQVGAIHLGVKTEYILEIINPSNKANNILIFLNIITAIVGIFVIVAFSLTITKPIKKLQLLTKDFLNDRDKEIKIEIDSRDEIGELAKDFSGMLVKINDQRKKLVERDYVESILYSMNESLLIIDKDGNIESLNKAAEELLGYNNSEIIGKPMKILFSDISEILNEIEEAAFIITPDYRICEVNKTFLNLIGASKREEVIGCFCHTLTHDFDHPCDNENEKCPIKESNETGKTAYCVHKHTDKDMKSIFVNIIAAPIKGKNGKIQYYLHLSQQSQSDALAGNMLSPMDRKKIEDLTLKFESAVEHIQLYKYVSDNNFDEIGNLRYVEVYFSKRNSRNIPVMVNGSAIRDQNNRIIKIIITASDITKRLDDALKLKEAKDNAEKASAAKSRFLANMSHEIRTPLNAIIGFLNLLQSTKMNEDQNDYVQAMSSSSHMLLSIINDILDISRIEAGEEVLEKVSFNLEYLIDDVFKIMRGRLSDKSITLYFDIEDNVPVYFEGDPTRIRQVCVNLLNNAIKFTDDGSISLHIYLHERIDQNMVKLRFVVKDTGIGIPDDKINEIFNSFTQVDMTATRKYEGTGLGLSICKAYVKLMSGEIWVTSKLGKGSEFIFTVLIKEKPVDTSKEIHPVSKEQLKGKDVFIVDKNIIVRDIVYKVCHEYGMNYNEVSTLRELTSVIDLKEKEFPHIIIVDLPHIDDDKKVIFQLKKNEKLKDTKFVVISQDASIGDAKKYSQLGFEAFLPKPLKQEELLKVISTILGDSRKSGEIVTRHLANEISCKGINVLVAEDNPINQKLIMAILNKMGCTFDVAPNGHEAIEKIKKKNYDVCLMDIMMPVMGGIEATRIIRSELKLSVPIIALSAATMESDVKESLISGMDDFLSKPIDANKLQQKLFKWGKSL